jgi:hypothetical protein
MMPNTEPPATTASKEPATINGYTALRRDRWSVRDLRGVHVRMPWKGRMLLGEIVDQYFQDYAPTGWHFKVRHFNGEPWPIDPCPAVVEVLLRRTGDD